MINLAFKFISSDILDTEETSKQMHECLLAKDGFLNEVKNIFIDDFNISFECSLDLKFKTKWNEIKEIFVKINSSYNFKKSYVKIVSDSKWSPSSEVYNPLWICFSATENEVSENFYAPDVFWEMMDHECIFTTPTGLSLFAFDLGRIVSIADLTNKTINLSLYLAHFTKAERIQNNEVFISPQELEDIQRQSFHIEYHDYNKENDCIVFFADRGYDQQMSFRDYFFLNEVIKAKEYYRTDLKQAEYSHLAHIKFSNITVRFYNEDGARELNLILKSMNIGVEFFHEKHDRYYPYLD